MIDMTQSDYKDLALVSCIPEDWEIQPIKRFLVSHDGGAWGEDAKGDLGDRICIRIADFDYVNGTVKENAELTVRNYPQNVIEKLSLQQGDIIVEKSGGGEQTPVGRSIVFQQQYEALFANFSERLRVQRKYNYNFVNYCLRAFYSIGGSYNYFNQTTGIQNLNIGKFLSNIYLPCPQRTIQDAIVRYLDSKCAAIDEAIERHKKIIEKLDEYKQTQIFKEMSAFPRVIPTKRVFKIYAGATPKSAVKDFWDGSIIWITPADFKTEDHYITQGKRNITQTGYDSCNTTIVPAGSLVVSKRAPIGTVGIAKVPLCTNQGCLTCVLDKDADAEFFYYALIYKNKEMQQLGAGTTFQEISATAFANMKLPYTQIEKQKIVSERLNMLDKKIQNYKEKHEIVISKLEEYRKSIIYHAVTGKIDCREAVK